MAYELRAADVIQFSVFCQAGDQTSVNVFNYMVQSVVDPGPSLNDAAARFSDLVVTQYAGCMSPQAQYLGVKASVITSGPPPMPGFKVEHTAGTMTGDLLPRAVSGLIQWQTDYSGKSYRGRTFVPFPSEAGSTSAGEPSTVYQTAVDDLASAIITMADISPGLGSANVYLVLWSRQLNEFTKIQTASVPLRWGTQHRRGDYGRIFVPPV